VNSERNHIDIQLSVEDRKLIDSARADLEAEVGIKLSYREFVLLLIKRVGL